MNNRACYTVCSHNANHACAYGGVTDIATCPCRQVEAKSAPVDPVSGLVPRFKPNEELPPGAALEELPPGAALIWQELWDWYWLPSGWQCAITGDGRFVDYKNANYDLPQSTAAARAFGLPLAGKDLAEDEEAWTDARLEQSYRLLPLRAVDEAPEVWQGYRPHCSVASAIGLDNLRRWKFGWVCRKLRRCEQCGRMF